MIFLNVDKSLETNFIYQQIYEGIKAGILEGRMKPDEKLPSKRMLADQLQVSVNSVANAYGQLLAEGYIYTIERSGYFVEKITKYVHTGNLNSKFPSDLNEPAPGKEGWLSLSHMTSNISLFPFKEWLKCEQKAILHHKSDLSEIPHPQGPYTVRKSISHLIALTRGAICKPEQIVIGEGTMSLIRQLLGMRKNNPVIAIENPGYSRLFTLLKNMDAGVHPVKLDEKGMKIDEIEKLGANFVYVTPSHQFPTGIIMPIARRIELLNWAGSSDDRYIIEDDYDSEFKYETDNIPSLQSFDRDQRVIYLGTFSKTMMPGLRISYMVLPPALLRRFRETYSNSIQPSNLLSLFTLNYFIESGEYIRHVKRMNHHYEMKRKLLINELHKQFKGKIHIEDIPAGLHFLARFKTKKTYSQIEAKATRTKLEIYTMQRFMLGSETRPASGTERQFPHSEANVETGRRFPDSKIEHVEEEGFINLVIGFASIQEEQIVEAVKRLYSVFQ